MACRRIGARVLLATVAFHCIAVADTVSVAGEEPAARPDRAHRGGQVEAEFAQGMCALIVGALAVLGSAGRSTRRCSGAAIGPAQRKTPPGSLLAAFRPSLRDGSVLAAGRFDQVVAELRLDRAGPRRPGR